MKTTHLIAIAAIVCGSGVASAQDNLSITDTDLLTLDDAWPAVPEDHSERLEDRMQDNATDYGNVVGSRLDELSHHAARVRVDVRKQTAFLHLGYGDVFSFDSNWLFTNGRAYISAKVDLDIGHHHWEVSLPEMDVTRDSYRNEGITEVNVSVLEKRF